MLYAIHLFLYHSGLSHISIEPEVQSHLSFIRFLILFPKKWYCADLIVAFLNNIIGAFVQMY